MGQVASTTLRPSERARSKARGPSPWARMRMVFPATPAATSASPRGRTPSPSSSCMAGVLWISLPERKTDPSDAPAALTARFQARLTPPQNPT